MALHNKRVPRSPLKQWVLYQEVGVCTGIAGSKKLKIIKKNNISQVKLLDVKVCTNVEGPTNCSTAMPTTRYSVLQK